MLCLSIIEIIIKQLEEYKIFTAQIFQTRYKQFVLPHDKTNKMTVRSKD